MKKGKKVCLFVIYIFIIIYTSSGVHSFCFIYAVPSCCLHDLYLFHPQLELPAHILVLYATTTTFQTGPFPAYIFLYAINLYGMHPSIILPLMTIVIYYSPMTTDFSKNNPAQRGLFFFSFSFPIYYYYIYINGIKNT